MPEVSPIVIEKIIEDDIKSAVFSALKQIDAKKLMNKDNMFVLIKPNILGAKPPERAVTTHPEVLRSVIQWVKQFNPGRIVIAESSGGQKVGTTMHAMKVSKILEVCEQEKVECIPFEKTEREIVNIENPIVLDSFPISKLVKQADLIINIPKIKTHTQCTLTCSIKNMFGTLILGHKPKTHAQFTKLDDFGAALADIYSASTPKLTVVDGYLCQEGNGPSGGDVVKMDLILAGYDPVAIDSTVCRIIGMEPMEINHIKHAKNRGLGVSKKEKIEILGTQIDSVKRDFKKPTSSQFSLQLPKWMRKYIGKTLFKARIKFDKEKCTRCGTCWTNCPTHAIKPPLQMKKGYVPNWDKSKCITCYCCTELCPYEAVDFEINIVRNVIQSWIGFGFISLIAIIILLIIFL